MSRALPSALAQGEHVEVITVHQPDGTLAAARNDAARNATGSHLVFLDADDELGDEYIDEMQRALGLVEGECLLVPRVSYTRDGKREAPKYHREVELTHGSWLPIGTTVSSAAFGHADGFREWPVFEDWDLFARIWKAGAEVVKVPNAIYVAHWDINGRNKIPTRAEKEQYHFEIGRSVFPDVYEETWLTNYRRSPLMRPPKMFARSV